MKGVQSPSRGSRPSGKRSIARVRKAFRPDVLARVCTLQDFSGYAPRTDLPARQGRERFLHYRDNGSNVLAVAHLDSVQPHTACTVVGTAAGPLALSGVLDDRLGAYVILEMLPRLGVTTDWLLTTDEEMGESTAAEFSSEKPYHWMFQFDRGGTDVVMYDYETPELVEMVEASGARVGVGSFSDICLLEHLGCAGFNWGVGYRDYHSRRAHAWLEDTFRMVARFLRFHAANADAALPHTPRSHYGDLVGFPFGEWCDECGSPVNDDGACPVCDGALFRRPSRAALGHRWRSVETEADRWPA